MVSDRDFGEFHIFNIEISHGWFFIDTIWFSPLFCDIWRVFKTKGVNYQVKREKKYPRREGEKGLFSFIGGLLYGMKKEGRI